MEECRYNIRKYIIVIRSTSLLNNLPNQVMKSLLLKDS